MQSFFCILNDIIETMPPRDCLIYIKGIMEVFCCYDLFDIRPEVLPFHRRSDMISRIRELICLIGSILHFLIIYRHFLLRSFVLFYRIVYHRVVFFETVYSFVSKNKYYSGNERQMVRQRVLELTICLATFVALVLCALYALGVFSSWEGGHSLRREYRIGDYAYSYTGAIVEGHFQGQGSLVWDSGENYVGDFAQSRFEGHGVYTFTDGSAFEGVFVEGMAEGTGKCLRSDGSVLYEGDFSAGFFDGEGSFFSEEAWVYRGGFVAGRFDGEGTVYEPDGEVVSGVWSKGVLIVRHE